MELEYRAFADGAKEAAYLSRLLSEIQLSETSVSLSCSENQILTDPSTASIPTIVDAHLFCDNTSAIKLTHNSIFHAHSKHIELHHHYV